MKWTRQRPGLYTAGPYAVMSLDTHRPIWTASGPDFTSVEGTKADAQLACQRAALLRIEGNGRTVVPVVGDHVVANNRTGKVTAILPSNNSQVYCMRFARGRRLCLFRIEFEVVMP